MLRATMNDAPTPVRHRLLPHPASARGAVQELIEGVTVDVRFADGQLLLAYCLTGEINALRLPESRPSARTDGLWRHTCFEAFVLRPGAAEYWEYNFSPSGAWAAYHFTGYREGMAPLMQGAPPAMKSVVAEDTLELEVVVDLAWLTRNPSGAGLRVGLAAVIEDRARMLSYWALQHPGAKPDFHHVDGFTVELD